MHYQNMVCSTVHRFSGLTEQDFKGVQSTLRDVQAVLLSLFSQHTILIGHSLESDLLALKLIHNTVVDTSVVFPHRLGPPYKRALRTLMGEVLQKIIQNDGVYIVIWGCGFLLYQQSLARRTNTQ